MGSPQKMDVADWQDSPPPVVVRKRAPRRFLPPTLIGILGTVLLHVLVIQSVPFGSRGPKAKPPEIQESADALSKSKADSAESIMLISLPTIADSNQPAAQHLVSSLPDLTIMKIQSPVEVDPPGLLNIEALALSEDQSSRPTSGNGDGAELAELFGIYTGQIQARIDRVWRRPRTPVNETTAGKKPTDADESFKCEAQIVQDARGNVQEVMLPRCNGSAAWQRSLVEAIQQASPLPAPPSTKVFTQSITLTFVGLPFVQGASKEEYEIVPLARVDQ
jgi:TonB C terminal